MALYENDEEMRRWLELPMETWPPEILRRHIRRLAIERGNLIQEVNRLKAKVSRLETEKEQQ